MTKLMSSSSSQEETQGVFVHAGQFKVVSDRIFAHRDFAQRYDKVGLSHAWKIFCLAIALSLLLLFFCYGKI